MDLRARIRKDLPVSRAWLERWRLLAADIRAARCTVAVVLLLCGVQLLAAWLGQPDWLYDRFGLSRAGILEGRIWQPLTYALLHGPWPGWWWHLAVNAFGLLIGGARLERIAGQSTFLKVFLAGVLIGGLVQLPTAPDPSKVLIGASGGIFAVMLWLVTLSPGARMWPIPVSARNLGIGVMVAEAGLLVASWLLPESGLALFGNGCHVAGGLTGWWLGRKQLGPLVSREDLLRERARRETIEDSRGLP